MLDVFELDEVANTPEEENLMIVDCLNFAFRYKNSGALEFAAKYVSTIRSFARSYGAKTVVLVADKKYSSFRKEILPEYKGNREEKYKDQSEEEKEKMRLFFEEYERALELCAEVFPLIRLEYVEADDLAAYLVKKISHNYKHTWLISSDKDWDLLLSDNVSRFSFVTRKEYNLENFYEYHDCDSPEQYISIKVFAGDSGDNVEGLSGWGAKRTYNLLREYATALDVYDAIPLQKKGALIDRINQSGDLIPKNYELMDLLSFCEDAIAHPNPDNLKYMEEFCARYS